MLRSISDYILKNTILAKRLKLLDKKKELYSSVTDDEDIYIYQLNRFNTTWKHCITNIPFYIKWQKEHSLPDQIASIEDLKIFPVLTKTEIHANQEFILENLKDYYLTSTGGTSGITTHFPTSNENADEAYVNAYLGRSWWGIEPLNNILMFWGHSHLFGRGYKRYIRQIKRKVSDILINTIKISSYSLDAYNIKEFYQSIEKVSPQSIISYSSNIFKICKYMQKNNIFYKSETLKGVILTSESVTQVDVELIEKYLNTSVINEYGMAETGSIAYSYNNTNNIRIFWDSFIVTTNDKKELMITTIGDSIFPLINYSSEDLVEIQKEYKGSVISLQKITGKARDVLKISLKDGTFKKISTIFFDHVLKFYPDIYSIHYKKNKESVDILLTSDVNLNLADVKKYIVKEVSKEFLDINFDLINIEQVDYVSKTIAGKNKTIL